ncbi:MAG: transposase [Chloroflexi bacterium]|nr:transposase [Chloroflexota bacterium]
MKIVLANNEVYHVFNRGIEQRPTFTNKREYTRALTTLDFYRFRNPSLRLSKVLLLEKEKRGEFFLNLKSGGERLVEIISYCLMPNHFHFLLRQRLDDGISEFLSNFSNSYTRYFNTKHKRTGALFQGIFKAVRMESDEQLIHVSRYIHLNPVVSFVVKEEDLETYPWSSLPEFLGTEKRGICHKELVLGLFPSKEKYREFVHDQIDYARRLEAIKHLALD